ncbi:MAG: MFS transporter [Bergeyella sp.]|nr:MFS transporter [Bergeyella sp.]
MSHSAPDLSTQERIKAILGGSIGNLVEWYDWYAYTAFAVYFSNSFFPKEDPLSQDLKAYGIFAVAFLMRPIGGWLFGSISDKIGRKKGMTISVILMSFGSLLIALSPTYATIGALATVILFSARLLQGLSVGGEYGVSATYLSEMATKERRGFYSSFQYVTLIGGHLIALAIQLVLQKFLLTEEQLYDWGWRIPFVIGAILSLVAFYLRSNLHETEAFENKKDEKTKKGSIKELLKHPKAILTVVGLTMGGTLAFYTYTVYIKNFMKDTLHFSNQEATTISFSCLLIFASLQPIFGSLSDKIGRKPLLLWFGIMGTIFTYPVFYMLSYTSTPLGAFFIILFALIIVSGYTSINAVVKAELFPAEIRALGVGLPYALTVAVFGGSAVYVATWFKKEGVESYFYVYVTVCIFISLLVYLGMKDTQKTSKLNED